MKTKKVIYYLSVFLLACIESYILGGDLFGAWIVFSHFVAFGAIAGLVAVGIGELVIFIETKYRDK